MASGRRYYWYKVDTNFFDKHYIKLMRKKNELFVLIYMMMLAEATTHDGELRFSEETPYTIEDLAIVLNFDESLINDAFDYFKEKKLMSIKDDGTIVMCLEKSMIGSESDWTAKKREYRNRTNEGQNEDKVRTSEDIWFPN